MNGYTEDEKEIVSRDNYKLIHFEVRKFLNNGISYEDLFSIASVGFTKALNAYDKDTGFKFSTYACNNMYYELLNTVNKNRRTKKTLSLDYDMENSNGSERGFAEILGFEEQGFLKLELEETLERLAKKLTKGEKEVFDQMLSGKKQSDIWKELGTTRQAVSRYVRNITVKFKTEWEGVME